MFDVGYNILPDVADYSIVQIGAENPFGYSFKFLCVVHIENPSFGLLFSDLVSL